MSAEDIATLCLDDIEYDINVLDQKLSSMKPNLSAIAEYRKKQGEYLSRVDELDTVTAERNAVRVRYDTLRKERLDMFMSGFKTISLKLKEMYQMITLGGDAELELVDYLNPFSEGIVFSVGCTVLGLRVVGGARTHTCTQSCSFSSPFSCSSFVSTTTSGSSTEEELEKHQQPVWR